MGPCVTSVETEHFSVVLFGSISDQLAAVGPTIQPNCSFSILCLFSDRQNTRMCNQGWALDEARQISQHCRPSLLCGCSPDAAEVYFLHSVCSLKMEESVTLNWRRYASDDSVSALIITHYLPFVDSICAWVDSVLFDLSWVESSRIIKFFLAHFWQASCQPSVLITTPFIIFLRPTRDYFERSVSSEVVSLNHSEL